MNLKALKELRKQGLPEATEKVTVMADDKEGLEKGLEKAKEIMKKGPESLLEDAEEVEESPLEDLHDLHDEDDEDDDDMDLSDEAIEAMSIDELKHCLKKLRD